MRGARKAKDVVASIGDPAAVETAQGAVDAAAAAVVEARAVVARWEEKHRTAADALARLEAEIGEAVLQEPERAEALTSQMTTLRDQVAVAQAAAGAARPRVAPLERAYLLALAELRQVRDVAAARAAYAEHGRRLASLVDQVKELEGVEGYFRAEYLDILEHRQPGESVSYRLPTSVVLQRALQKAEYPVLVIRELAEGRDPQALVDTWRTDVEVDYPAEVWGPQALVPARRYTAAIERAYEQLAELERDLDALPGKYEALVDQMYRAGHTAPPPPGEWLGWREESLREQIAAARTHLAELGQPVD